MFSMWRNRTPDHRGQSLVQHFCYKKFVELTPAGRFNLLREKGLCHQCLAPGAPSNTSKHTPDCFLYIVAKIKCMKNILRKNMF